MRRGAAMILIALALVVMVPAGASHGAQVAIRDFVFVDSQSGNSASQIHVGDSVTWTWEGDFPHSATGGLLFIPLFDSGVRSSTYDQQGNPTQTYTYQFAVPGVYSYRCTVHTSMQGQIVVSP